MPALSFQHVKIELSRKPSEPDWSALVDALGGNPLHRPEVTELEFGTQALRFLTMRRSHELIGCGVAAQSERKFAKLLRIARALQFPTVPAMRDDCNGEFIVGLAAFAKQHGFTHLRIDGRWGADLSADPLLAPWVTRTFIEFTIDLRGDLDVLLSRMDKYHRKNIRRVERAGVTVTEDSSLEGLYRLREMLVSAASRAASAGNVLNVRERRWFERAHHVIYRGELGNVLFAHIEDEPVAALAYLRTKDRAITVRSGSTQRGYENSAMYLLQFELMRRLRESGVRELNLGAVPEKAVNPGESQHGLLKFKKGFGGDLKRRTSLSIQLARFNP